jgi:hypothetical protein
MWRSGREGKGDGGGDAGYGVMDETKYVSFLNQYWSTKNDMNI